MSFDLHTGGIVPLESLVPEISPNGETALAAQPADAVVHPPAPIATPPAAAAESAPTQSPARTTAPAPRLRPNRLLWRGRLASDPELRRSKAGIDYCAVRVLQDVLDSQRQPTTQGIDVVLYRERAHDFARTFRKGDLVEIMGELRIRDWQDKSGAKHTRVSLYPSEEIALISRPQWGPRIFVIQVCWDSDRRGEAGWFPSPTCATLLSWTTNNGARARARPSPGPALGAWSGAERRQMPMRKWRVLRNTLIHAPSQPHSALRRTHRAFTLTELLVALAITALIITFGVGMVAQWSTGNRTLPVLAARQASDAQVQQMIGELRSAVAISFITSDEVVAAINTNGSSGLTPTVNGAPTGAYKVAYYFWATNGTLYRNGGPQASFGSPSSYNPSLPTWAMPTPPTAPSVNPPGAHPTAPACASPCYNPTSAYLWYTRYSWGGGTANHTTNSGGNYHSGGIRGHAWGCAMYYDLWTGNGYNQPTGGRSYNLTPGQAGQGSESYLGLGSYYCDWTRNGAMVSGSYVAIRTDRSGTLYFWCGHEGTCSWSGSVTSLFYVPASSAACYKLPNAWNRVLCGGWYTSDVNNWNSYQSALNAYNQNLTTWNWELSQWWAYGKNYSAYAQGIKAWDTTIANGFTNLQNQSPSAHTWVSSGSWSSTMYWKIVAVGIQSLSFTGYTQAMTPTTTPNWIRTLGVTVQYAGQPAEREMLTLGGTTAYSATVTRPLVIPPAPPDPRPCAACAIWPNTAYSSWTLSESGGRGWMTHAAEFGIGPWGGASFDSSRTVWRSWVQSFCNCVDHTGVPGGAWDAW